MILVIGSVQNVLICRLTLISAGLYVKSCEAMYQIQFGTSVGPKRMNLIAIPPCSKKTLRFVFYVDTYKNINK